MENDKNFCRGPVHGQLRRPRARGHHSEHQLLRHPQGLRVGASFHSPYQKLVSFSFARRKVHTCNSLGQVGGGGGAGIFSPPRAHSQKWRNISRFVGKKDAALAVSP
ncbi:MAG: hypothetical protein GY820_35910, partial [Gammaproteobacteria bacterium]|nr:hypothetical protein [Gammaproteobacteria bacterium]